MKKLFKYIRFRVCRSIYYADWCPMDNRKNYRKIFENFLAVLGLGLSGVIALVLLFLIGF